MASLDDLAAELKVLNKRLKFLATMQSVNSFAFPVSGYWTWFQKSGTQVYTINAGQTLSLVQTSDLPSAYGWLHSLNLSASSGDLILSLISSSRGGGQTRLRGSLQDFWLAGFNPRMPASAGDPVVVKTSTDEPAGFPAVPEWKARVSPSFNVPFNTPFTFNAINNTSAAITLYNYDVYFVMLTKDFVYLMGQAETQKLIYSTADGLD